MKENRKRGWHLRHLRVSVALLLVLSTHIDATKFKRQIFREQVLPALGGKIPEEAFRTDRLALNRLNKEGITVPDGIILDARHVHKNPQRRPGMPELLKVYLMPDGRYVPPEGRYNYNHPNAIDTTYLIQKPFTLSARRYEPRHGYSFRQKPRPSNQYRTFVNPSASPKAAIYKPIIAPLVIPADSQIFDESYIPTWDLRYHWSAPYEPLQRYYIQNIAFFDSHQIITDYEGFLKEFYKRSSRHVSATSNGGIDAAVDKQNSSGKGIKNVKFWGNARAQR